MNWARDGKPAEQRGEDSSTSLRETRAQTPPLTRDAREVGILRKPRSFDKRNGTICHVPSPSTETPLSARSTVVGNHTTNHIHEGKKSARRANAPQSLTPVGRDWLPSREACLQKTGPSGRLAPPREERLPGPWRPARPNLPWSSGVYEESKKVLSRAETGPAIGAWKLKRKENEVYDPPGRPRF
jgi:hypothetical protein